MSTRNGTTPSTLRVEADPADARVAWLTMDDPDRLNAMGRRF